jgi:hypothetical protein
MNKILDTFEIWFWELAVKILTKGYGLRCKGFESKCVECRAKKTVEFINEHIELIKFFR